MNLVLDIVSGILLITGGLIGVISGIGLLRLHDVYARMHAASMLDTLGAACVLIGLMLQATSLVIAIKLFLVLLFLGLTTTTAGHALAKSAIAFGKVPRDVNGYPIETQRLKPEIETQSPEREEVSSSKH